MYLTNNGIYCDISNHHLRKIIESYWENLEIETRQVEYTDEQLNEIYTMISSLDENTLKVAIDIIYGMHPKYIKHLHNLISKNQNNNYIQLSKFNSIVSTVSDTNIKLGILLYPITLSSTYIYNYTFKDVFTLPSLESNFSNKYTPKIDGVVFK